MQKRTGATRGSTSLLHKVIACILSIMLMMSYSSIAYAFDGEAADATTTEDTSASDATTDESVESEGATDAEEAEEAASIDSEADGATNSDAEADEADGSALSLSIVDTLAAIGAEAEEAASESAETNAIQTLDSQSAGAFTVTTDKTYETDWTFENQIITIKSGGDYTITGDGSVQSDYQIVIEGEIEVDLTINNVKITNSSAAAMNIDSAASVVLYLEGDNSFSSGSSYAGIQFQNASTGASLTITSTSNGSLTAQGGQYGAGIGGGNTAAGNNITISGGTVTATGGTSGAGIGGGDGGSASNITISGGNVTAAGNEGSVGIGGGLEGSASNIEITGGTVTATSATYVGMEIAAIGSGYGASEAATVSINYTNGCYYRTSSGADLKYSEDGSDIDTTAPYVQIYPIDSAHFTLEDPDGQIHYYFEPTVIAIETGGNWVLTGDDCEDHSGYQITIAENIDVTLTLNNVKITSGSAAAAMDIAGTATVILNLEGENSFTSTAYRYAGIQFQNASEGASLTITSTSNGSLTATGGESAAGIGGGLSGQGNYITISGGTVTATGGEYGAGIGGGDYASASNITISGGTVTAQGGYDGAGIGGGYGGSGSYITISGGTVTAMGGDYAAGIGGGYDGLGSYITISGGTVTAQGGYEAAGIGGGEYSSASNIAISGGTVTATGGNYAAGIGGGWDGGSGSDITISGGTVTATGKDGGAGIGGGPYGSASNIEISGGTVTATGGDWYGDYGAAGIGGGVYASASSITITGGTITATAGNSSADAIGSGQYGEAATDITVNYEGGYSWRISSSDSFTSSATEALELPGEYIGYYTYVQIIDKSGWTRLAGDDRYATMVKVVQEAFTDDSADYVVIASGQNFADSLTASSLAGALDAPIILVSANSITESALEEIKRVGASYAYIVGGTSSVSESVATQVETIVGSGNVERLSGSDRYATAVEVAKETVSILASQGKTLDTVILASGTVYADALSISPYAYASASPIILVGSSGMLDDDSADWVASSGATSLIIAGGSSSVSGDVVSQTGIKNSRRLAGSDRYETSVAIANWAIDNGHLNTNGVVIASGQNFPDALASSALCGQLGIALILVPNSSNVEVENFISANAIDMAYGYTVGGTGSVSEAVEEAIKEAAELS